LNNAEANAAIGYAAIVVLGTGKGLEPDPALQQQIRIIRTIREDVPIALLGDPDTWAEEELIRQFGIAGYISTTSPSEVAAAALRLIAAGGRYIPYKIGTNRPDRGSAEIQDAAAITGEAEALLSPRERDVLQCLQRGLPNKLIAHTLGISIGTAKMHVHNIIAKLKVRNRTEAAVSRHELDRVADTSLINNSNACRSVRPRQTDNRVLRWSSPGIVQRPC
jgi:DNA-binding NarL/FixJ family response regulator